MTSKPDDRAERLAAALRANLRRRKVQAREAEAGAPAPAPEDLSPDAPVP
jgi:hypothetical protein